MTPTACPHSRAIASTTLVDGQTVWCCRDCRHVRLDGTAAWLPGGRGILDQLRVMALRRDQAVANERAMWESDISDPRWTRLDDL